MTLKEKIQKVWENRVQIADGLYHTWISCTEEQEQEAQRRLEICKQDKCGYYDATGTHQSLVMKGKPGCTACGCTIDYKVHCFSCDCSLKQKDLTPLWEAIITEEQDNKIREEAYQQQFKPKDNQAETNNP